MRTTAIAPRKTSPFRVPTIARLVMVSVGSLAVIGVAIGWLVLRGERARLYDGP